jgi:hypothetical protein
VKLARRNITESCTGNRNRFWCVRNASSQFDMPAPAGRAQVRWTVWHPRISSFSCLKIRIQTVGLARVFKETE